MRADYLRATPVRVLNSLDGLRIFFIEARPAAARLEFSLCRIERVVTAPANKRAGRKHLLVLAGEWPFRSFVSDYSLFVRRQLIVWHLNVPSNACISSLR